MPSSREPLLEVRGLTKHYPIEKGFLRRKAGKVSAVDGLSFTIGHGVTLGLVGESGCGKSTVGKCIAQLLSLTAGEVRLNGGRIDNLPPGALHGTRRHLQMIFQDPYSSLNPRMTVRDIVAEPLRNYAVARGAELEVLVEELLMRVGLRRDQMKSKPHEFSGGQRQRIGIARALALRPQLIICDEPVSALDVSVQAQVINLLVRLQAEFDLSYLFIAHDLAVVKHISHRVAVMYLGRIVEMADTDRLYAHPIHPYTEALMSAVPIPDPDARLERIILRGDVPSPINLPTGCRFHNRCPIAGKRCAEEEPALREVAPGHVVACHNRGA